MGDEQLDHVIKVNSVSSFTSRFVDEAFQTSELSQLHRSSVRRNTPFFALTRRPTLQEQELEVATEAELPSMALLQSNVQRKSSRGSGQRPACTLQNLLTAVASLPQRSTPGLHMPSRYSSICLQNADVHALHFHQ